MRYVFLFVVVAEERYAARRFDVLRLRDARLRLDRAELRRRRGILLVDNKH